MIGASVAERCSCGLAVLQHNKLDLIALRIIAENASICLEHPAVMDRSSVNARVRGRDRRFEPGEAVIYDVLPILRDGSSREQYKQEQV